MIRVCNYCFIENKGKFIGLTSDSFAVAYVEARVYPEPLEDEHDLSPSSETVALKEANSPDEERRKRRLHFCAKHWQMNIWSFLLTDQETYDTIKALIERRKDGNSEDPASSE